MLQDEIDIVTSNSTFEPSASGLGPLPPEPVTVVNPSGHGDPQLHEDNFDDTVTLSEFESPETDSESEYNHLKMLESHSQAQASLKSHGES